LIKQNAFEPSKLQLVERKCRQINQQIRNMKEEGGEGEDEEGGEEGGEEERKQSLGPLGETGKRNPE